MDCCTAPSLGASELQPPSSSSSLLHPSLRLAAVLAVLPLDLGPEVAPAAPGALVLDDLVGARAAPFHQPAIAAALELGQARLWAVAAIAIASCGGLGGLGGGGSGGGRDGHWGRNW